MILAASSIFSLLHSSRDYELPFYIGRILLIRPDNKKINQKILGRAEVPSKVLYRSSGQDHFLQASLWIEQSSFESFLSMARPIFSPRKWHSAITLEVLMWLVNQEMVLESREKVCLVLHKYAHLWNRWFEQTYKEGNLTIIFHNWFPIPLLSLAKSHLRQIWPLATYP